MEKWCYGCSKYKLARLMKPVGLNRIKELCIRCVSNYEGRGLIKRPQTEAKKRKAYLSGEAFSADRFQ